VADNRDLLDHAVVHAVLLEVMAVATRAQKPLGK
jgi:hypothetical protein